MNISDSFLSKLLRPVTLVLSICIVAFISTAPQSVNDFWMQAKVGEMILQNHAIPNTLIFPFTEASDYTFNAHEWLPSVIFHLMVMYCGEDALPFILGVLGLCFWSLVLLLAFRRSDGNFPLSLAAALMATVVENYRHVLRPELLSLFIFIIFLSVLSEMTDKPSPFKLLYSCLLTVAWANIHGSFILAPFIAGIFAFGSLVQDLKAAQDSRFFFSRFTRFFLCLLPLICFCLLLNPFGWGLVKFVFSFSNSLAAKQSIAEWLPITDFRLQHVLGLWIGCLCILVTLIVCLPFSKHLVAVELLLLAMVYILSFRAVRFLVYAGIVSAYIIPHLLRDQLRSLRSQLFVYLVVSLFCIFLLNFSIRYGNANGDFPYQSDGGEVLSRPMIQVLSNANLRGNVFNSYDLGAELVYRAYPRLRPSIDSRIDSYGDAYFNYCDRLLTDGKEFSFFVKKYDVRYVLLTFDDFTIFSRQQSYLNGDWVGVAFDRHSALLRRRDVELN